MDFIFIVVSWLVRTRAPQTNCGCRLVFRHPRKAGMPHRLRANARRQSSKLHGTQPAKPDHENIRPESPLRLPRSRPAGGRRTSSRTLGQDATRQRRACKIVAGWFSMSEQRRADGWRLRRLREDLAHGRPMHLVKEVAHGKIARFWHPLPVSSRRRPFGPGRIFH